MTIIPERRTVLVDYIDWQLWRRTGVRRVVKTLELPYPAFPEEPDGSDE